MSTTPFLKPNTQIDKINSDLREVVVIAKENINKALERGENIEKALVQTEEMTERASLFKNASRRYKRALCIKRAKVIGCSVLFVVLFITIMVVLLRRK